MTRFQIYTEARENLTDLTGIYFDNASLVTVTGIYARKRESAIIIEVIELDDYWYHNSKAKINNLAERIKAVNGQECVLVTESKLNAKLV